MKKGRIKERFKSFTANRGAILPALLLAVLVAFAIWLFYNLSLRYSHYLSVPIVAKCNIEGHAAQSANTCEVIARCRTTGYNIMRIRSISSKHPIVVSLSKIHPVEGEFFYVTSGELHDYVNTIFGENATLEYFLSDTLFFAFPFESSKRVPVRPMTDISLKSQFMLVGNIKVDPDSVTIYGEPYRLSDIDYVHTELIKLSKVNSNIRGVTRMEKMRGFRLSNENVRYTADVVKFVEISKSVPVMGRNVPDDKRMMVYPSTAQAKLRCRFPYKNHQADSVAFFIDYNDFITSRSGKCVVKTNPLPAEVIDYSIEPEIFDCLVNDR